VYPFTLGVQIITMKEKYIQILGLALTLVYGVFVIFLYAAEPRSIEEISMKARSAVDDAVTKGQVISGTYEVDQAKFNAGLQAFRQDNFVAARDAFERADPERRDPRTQFYIAYSFYRQGWGRVSNDDALFKQALESAERVAMLDRNFRSDDANLQLRTPAELRSELEEGLEVTADDFNPLRLVRERK
jgi:hypothetical protein